MRDEARRRDEVKRLAQELGRHCEVMLAKIDAVAEQARPQTDQVCGTAESAETVMTIPPPGLMVKERLNGAVFVAQVHNPGCDRRFVNQIIEDGADSLIIWARDNNVYRAIVKNLEEQSDVRLNREQRCQMK
jgi:hypothetical protein